jgi:hypothetical protein
MEVRTYKILILFREKEFDNNLIKQKMRKYTRMIQRFQRLESVRIEWYLAYAIPKIPSYAYISEAVTEYLLEQEQQGHTILHNLGRMLDIPESRRHLLEGQADYQAHKLGKQLQVNKVIGYHRFYRQLVQWGWHWRQYGLPSLKKYLVLRNPKFFKQLDYFFHGKIS